MGWSRLRNRQLRWNPAVSFPGSAPAPRSVRWNPSEAWPSLFCLAALLLTGCARFEPHPLSPVQTAAEFDSRSLTNSGLAAFLSANHAQVPEPGNPWELNELTLAAFYYQPSLGVARAQWEGAQAGKLTAAQRPNPTLGVVPGYDSQIPGTPSPWIVTVTLDVPIETAGKRGYRIAQARHLSEAARWNLATTAWQTRSRVRMNLLGLYIAQETRLLLDRQENALSNVVRLLEGQLAVGNVSEYDITQARISLNTTRLSGQDAYRQYLYARSQLADSIGIPLSALADVALSFKGLDVFPTELTARSVRSAALLNRTDVRMALAQYAASQSALQLEIAKQYPDVNIGPGYAWNTGSAGDNMWQIGLNVTLPVLNHNQGPIAEAKARRSEAAAVFRQVQAQVAAQVDGAVAAYDAAVQQSTTAAALLKELNERLKSVRTMEQAGAVDALAVANAEVEYNTGALSNLDALNKAQQARGQLEDAVQSPLVLSSAALQSTEKNPGQPKSAPLK